MTTILESAAGFLLAMLIRPVIALVLARLNGREHMVRGTKIQQYLGLL